MSTMRAIWDSHAPVNPRKKETAPIPKKSPNTLINPQNIMPQVGKITLKPRAKKEWVASHAGQPTKRHRYNKKNKN